MITCRHCGHTIDTRNLTEVVAVETIPILGESAFDAIEWADIACESAATGIAAEIINTEMRDGDSYLRMAQMENALDALSEAAYERQPSRGGFLDADRMLRSLEVRR